MTIENDNTLPTKHNEIQKIKSVLEVVHVARGRIIDNHFHFRISVDRKIVPIFLQQMIRPGGRIAQPAVFRAESLIEKNFFKFLWPFGSDHSCPD
jgi:hypothetical protein